MTRKFKKALSLTLAITIIISATFGTSLITFATPAITTGLVLSYDMTQTDTTLGAAAIKAQDNTSLDAYNGETTNGVPTSVAGEGPLGSINRNVRRFAQSQYFKVPSTNNPINNQNITTMELWIKPSTTGTAGTQKLLSKRDGTTEYWFLNIEGTPTGSLLRYGRRFTGTSAALPNTPYTMEWNTVDTSNTSYDCVENNNWNHIVVTHDANSTANAPKIYVNGALIGVKARTSTAYGTPLSDSTADLFIGAKIKSIANNIPTLDTAGNNYCGDMGPVRLYNSMLSQTDIIANFNGEKSIFQPTKSNLLNPEKLLVDFAPYNTTPASGNVLDFGMPYGTRANGNTYGWVCATTGYPALGLRKASVITGQADERDNTSGLLVIPTGDYPIWEADVINGRYYTVTVGTGDPVNKSGVTWVKIEGTPSVQTQLSNSITLNKLTRTVKVTDGKVSVDFTSSSGNAKLTYVSITPAYEFGSSTFSDGATNGTLFNNSTSVKAVLPITRHSIDTSTILTSLTNIVAAYDKTTNELIAINVNPVLTSSLGAEAVTNINTVLNLPAGKTAADCKIKLFLFDTLTNIYPLISSATAIPVTP